MLYIAYRKIKLNSQPIFNIKSTITTFASTMKTIISIFLYFKIKFERKPIHFNIKDLCMGDNNVEIYKIEKRKTHEKNTKKRSEINKKLNIATITTTTTTTTTMTTTTTTTSIITTTTTITTIDTTSTNNYYYYDYYYATSEQNLLAKSTYLHLIVVIKIS